MSSPNPSLSAATPVAPSFWAREEASLKQGIKTGLAGAITYAIYAGFHLHQGYWAVFAALVVTQANLGASWKAALYRTIGSTAGALAAALLIPLLGPGPAGVGVTLLILGSLFGYLTALHPAFTAAGFTAAIILVFGGQSEPWHTAWLRVLYTAEGAFIAFAIGASIWPVHARVALRYKIANILTGSGRLYRAVTAAALEGIDNEAEVRELDRKLHDLRRGITEQMDQARSELAFSRFNQGAYQQVVEFGDQIRRRLTSMAEDSSLYVHAQIDPGIVPSLPLLADKTAQNFEALAEAMRNPGKAVSSVELEAVLARLDAELATLREQRVTTPLTLDRMLPFWALVFNLREVAEDLKQLESVLPELA
ncbi:MAG TPA: FUSC family protein [Verrucomicrobiae bacterium]|nr:FUSC family protein [Verrucomicrobiae bacterium]